MGGAVPLGPSPAARAALDLGRLLAAKSASEPHDACRVSDEGKRTARVPREGAVVVHVEALAPRAS
eukprot:2580001-Rhodomonas_salina.1